MKLKQTIMALALAACPLVANADYPIFWQRYTADPSAFVWNGRLYIFCSHDTYETVRGYNYFMNDVTCISTTDMKNWTDHGEVFSYKNSKWGAKMTWAPQVIERNGKFYLYYGDGGNAIGVAVADNPIGPYVDEPRHLLATPLRALTSSTVRAMSCIRCPDSPAHLAEQKTGDCGVSTLRLLLTKTDRRISISVERILKTHAS